MGMSVIFPPQYDQRVLALEAPGGAPAKVSIAIPTITRPGRAFRACVAVLDELGYPSVQCAGVKLTDQGGQLLAEIAFQRGQPSVAMVEALTAAEGFSRLRADLGGQVFYSNPTLCTAADCHEIFWGDPHVHSVLSQCHPDKCRSLDFGYAAGRYVSGLDWMAVADHVSNGRCEFARFKQQMLACEAHDDPPEFVTLPAYEASLVGGAGGDANVYMTRWPEMFIDQHDEGNLLTLAGKLEEKLGAGQAIVVPHHTTRSGKHGEIPDAIYPGPDAMPVVEIHSKWGTSEYRGNPNALKDVNPGPSYVQDFLARGLRVGFVGGTDTHATMPAGGGFEPGHIDRLPGMTAVRCPSLTRQNVYAAMASRRCYATSLERIYLDAQIAGLGGGEMTKWTGGDRAIDVTAAAQSDIVSIDVIRNGRVIVSQRPGDWHAKLTARDNDAMDSLWLDSKYVGRFVYYCARVTCASGAQAWSSPVWLQA